MPTEISGLLEWRAQAMPTEISGLLEWTAGVITEESGLLEWSEEAVIEDVSGLLEWQEKAAPPPISEEMCKDLPGADIPLVGGIVQGLCLVFYRLSKAADSILSPVIDGIWDALPAPITSFFTDSGKLITAVVTFFTDPRQFMLLLFNAVFSAKSPSLADDARNALASNLTGVYTSGPDINIDPFAAYIKGKFQDAARRYIPQYIAIIEDTTSTPADILAKLVDLNATIQAEYGALATWLEALSLGQVDAPTQFASQIAQSIGVTASIQFYQQQAFAANIQERARQDANKQFQLAIPDVQEVIQSRRLENITKEDYDDLIARSRGLSPKWGDLLYRNSLAPPSLDDFITYDLRHPESAVTLEQIAAIANIDALPPPEGRVDYRPIFQERFYIDPTVTQARFMYETGGADDAYVKDIIRRQRFRTEPLPGQKVSDADAMLTFVTGFQTRIWRRQRLLSLRAKFIAGKATEDDLRKEAGKLLTNPDAIDVYIEAAKDRKELAEAKVETKRGARLTAADITDLVELGKIEEGAIVDELVDAGYDEDVAAQKAIIIKEDVRRRLEGRPTVRIPISIWFAALVKKLKTPEDLVKELVERGLSEDQARFWVDVATAPKPPAE